MSKFTFKELAPGERFNPLKLYAGTPFTQSQFYGRWNAHSAHEVRRFVVKDGAEPVAYWQQIKWPLPYGKSLLYLPYGPVIKTATPELLSAIATKLGQLLKAEGGVFARVDFSPGVEPRFLSPRLFKAVPTYSYDASYVQPRLEWVLELNEPLDNLLARMSRKDRYGVRLAKNRGVEFKIVDSGFFEYYDRFYKLMKVMAARKGFKLHTEAYYRAIFDDIERHGHAFLVVATYEGKIVAIDVIIPYGTYANYVFGCASEAHSKLMLGYSTLWEAITHAKKIGCTVFNFGGYAVNKNKRSTLSGVDAFKERFGGHRLEHSALYDVVASPFWYRLYNLRKLIKASRARIG